MLYLKMFDKRYFICNNSIFLSPLIVKFFTIPKTIMLIAKIDMAKKKSLKKEVFLYI